MKEVEAKYCQDMQGVLACVRQGNNMVALNRMWLRPLGALAFKDQYIFIHTERRDDEHGSF